MPQSAQRKDYPLSVRLPLSDVAMIDRAADLEGRSRTEFIRDAAVRAAEDVVMELGLVRMSEAAFSDFVACLSAEPEPVGEMVTLLRRTPPWEVPVGE